jgi:hypothetical protein
MPVDPPLGTGLLLLSKRLGRYFTAVYATADPRSLAAGRIALALVLLIDLAMRVPGLVTWYTNEGILPNHTLLWRPNHQWAFSFFYMASLPHEAAIGFVVSALAYLALLLGFRTRVAHVASFLCVLSLHTRNSINIYGGEVALVELCLWTMFLPTGRRFSIDALRARQRAAGDEAGPAPPDTRPVVSLAVAALLMQLAVIYFFSAVQKTGVTWRDGSAVWWALHQSRVVTALGLWARAHLPLDLLRGFTWASYALEWAVAVLLLVPVARTWTRRPAVIAIWLLHVGFALFINLGIFVPVMLAYTPNLLRAADWEALGRWRARLGRTAGPLAASVRDAWSRATRPLVRAAGDGTAPLSPDARRTLTMVREATVAALVVVATCTLLVDNHAARRLVRLKVPQLVEMTVSYLHLFQAWSMFAPDAPTTDANTYVDAVTEDGRHVDPLSELAHPRYPAPGRHMVDRWDQDTFFCEYGLRIAGRGEYHPAFIDWIRRYPERTGNPRDRIVSFEAFVIEQDSPPPGQRGGRNLRVTSFLKWP